MQTFLFDGIIPEVLAHGTVSRRSSACQTPASQCCSPIRHTPQSIACSDCPSKRLLSPSGAPKPLQLYRQDSVTDNHFGVSEPLSAWMLTCPSPKSHQSTQRLMPMRRVPPPAAALRSRSRLHDFGPLAHSAVTRVPPAAGGGGWAPRSPLQPAAESPPTSNDSNECKGHRGTQKFDARLIALCRQAVAMRGVAGSSPTQRSCAVALPAGGSPSAAWIRSGASVNQDCCFATSPLRGMEDAAATKAIIGGSDYTVSMPLPTLRPRSEGPSHSRGPAMRVL